MRYFFDIHAVANATSEVKFKIIAPPVTDEKQKGCIPKLTPEMVKKNAAYAEFAKAKFPLVMMTYTVYKTEVDITKTEELQLLLDNKKAEKVTSGELQITSKVKRKKSKMTKRALYAIIGGITAFSIGLGVVIGVGLGAKTTNTNLTEFEGDDGLIMPNVIKFSPNAELLTISIDRSYSPVPREDLQIKGELINGVAKITLPAFDRNDFFTHVAGYTWGFTSDINGTKIEYYGGKTYEFTENVKLYRVLVKYGGGNGTKNDPYLINYFDQLQLLSSEKARGYFRQTEDIEFPIWATHTSINTVNELKEIPDSERFEYDGGGYTISGLTAPLFGTVSGSVIKNVNLTNSTITSDKHENYGLIVSQAYNYRYQIDGKVYETGETLIQNCSVSNSSIYLQIPETDEYGNPVPQIIEPVALVEPQPVVPPDVVLEEVDTPIFPMKQGEFAIGGISGIGGEIEDCFVYNLTISSQLDNYFLHVGGISGKPANVTNSGVSYLTIKGNIFHAGGIAGSAGGSRLYSADGRELPIFYGGNIQGCFVRDFVARVETSAGGIVGEATTNADFALISNNYATGLDFLVGVFDDNDKEKVTPIKEGFSGGIIGADGNENNGHLVINTVSDALYPVIGNMTISEFDDTVRLAPLHAFSQIGIFDVLNRNTVNPNNPDVIFAGHFVFDDMFNEGENFPLPSGIINLYERLVTANEE